ncbi:MAG TPA: M35 family metallo-endopeptidase [Casimicrobium huifangae]|jgi:peptidyl-Lys metalloendopeptidase|nr:M35 family metallo-endopeptidase [Casimicrobium huifangae]
MKRIWQLCALTALAAGIASAHAAPRDRSLDNVQGGDVASVQTSVQSAKAYHRATDDVTVSVQFTNTGSAAVTLPQWLLDGDEVDRSFLKVTRNGAAVPYTAALVKRANPTADELVVLMPGQSITASYELSSAFDLSSGGSFEVSFGTVAQNAATSNVQPSESISIGVEANPFRDIITDIDYSKAAGAGGISYTGKCTASQKSSLVTALGNALVYSDGAKNYLTNTTPSGTPRYSTWFGTYSSANWNTVKSHYTNISSVYNTQPIVFDCSCKKTNTYAYVYPSQPYKIYLCGAFWNAPATGTDSKAGTLVHETSHFTVVAGTQDYAYGQSAAKSLAISNPSQAIMNADSHEYFAENTPAQQ